MIKQLAVAIALVVTPAAFAQSYIVADGDCGSVTLHATRGADFPNVGERIAADRVAQAYLYLPQQRVAVKPAAGAASADFNAKIPETGIVVASVDFAPTISGNETLTEHAKTFIYCEPATPRADWQRSSDLGLEIYPQWNGRVPSKPGDKMRFIAVDKATHKLLRDVPMELYRAGAGRVATGTPDPNGGMDFSYTEPGRYMVSTTYRRPDPQVPDHWLVDTSTATFELK